MNDGEHPAEWRRSGFELMRTFQCAHARALHEIFGIVLIARNAQRECPQARKHRRQERGQLGDSHRLGRFHFSTIGLSGKPSF